MSDIEKAIPICQPEEYVVDETLRPQYIVAIPTDGQDGHTAQMNRLLEELRNILPLVAGTEVTMAISTIGSIDGADDNMRVELIKELAEKSLEAKVDIFARIENIFHCVTGN